MRSSKVIKRDFVMTINELNKHYLINYQEKLT